MGLFKRLFFLFRCPSKTDQLIIEVTIGDKMESKEKLFNKNYFLLWQGQTISRIGTNIFTVSMVLWLIDYKDKASLLALMGMLGAIPAVLLSPIGGTIADNYSRRKILIICDYMKGVLMVALAAVFYFMNTSLNIIVTALLIVTVLTASINSIFDPAITASLPDIVSKEKLRAANSFSQSSIQIISILGQMLGSSLYFLLGAPMVVFLNGFSFLYSSASELFISIPQKMNREKRSAGSQLKVFKNDMKEGVRFIWQKKGLKKMILISAMLTFFSVPIILLFPYYLEKVLSIDKAWYPFFLSVYLVGNLSGYLLAGLNVIPVKQKNKILIIFILLHAMSYGFIGFARYIYLALFLIFSAGLMSGFVQVSITTIMQSTTPSEIRGRVFGFIGTLGSSLSPVAMIAAGIAADVTNKNITLIYASCSACMLVLAVIVLFNKDIRAFLFQEKEYASNEAQVLENKQVLIKH